MPSNEEINRLIATKIMGWELLTVGHFGTEDETPRQRQLSDWMDEMGLESVGHYWVNVDTDFCLEEDRWEPSENIAQAWQVLEKFPYPPWDILVSRSEEGWLCALFCLGLKMSDKVTETAPLAICLCALKAMEVVRKHEEMDTSLRDI